MDDIIARYEYAAAHGIDAENARQLGLKQPPLVDSYPLLEAVPATPTLLTKMGWPVSWGIRWMLVPAEKGA